MLGKEDIELQEQIKLLKQEIKKLSSENEDKNKEISKLDLENKLTNKARELDRIKSPYDKRKLRNSLEKIKLDPKKYCLSKEYVQGLLETSRASPKDKFSEISIETLCQGMADRVKNHFGNYLLPLTPIINSIIGNSYIKIG